MADAVHTLQGPVVAITHARLCNCLAGSWRAAASTQLGSTMVPQQLPHAGSVDAYDDEHVEMTRHKHL